MYSIIIYYHNNNFFIPYRIEHLYPDVLEEVPFTVFGFIKPKLAIFTTPNFEFNILFNDFKSKKNNFRHYDHKFEWTREQFENWFVMI